MSASSLSHWCANVAPVSPTASAMPDTDAVSVSPTRALPPMAGRPVGGVLTRSTGAGPATVADGVFDSRRPSAAHTAPTSSQGRSAASDSVTSSPEDGATSITDILLEVDDATRFTEAFTHLRTGSPCRDRIGLLNVAARRGNQPRPAQDGRSHDHARVLGIDAHRALARGG